MQNYKYDRNKILQIAKKIEAWKGDIVVSFRDLECVFLHCDDKEGEELYRYIQWINSETEYSIKGEARDHFSRSFIDERDKEENETLMNHKKSIQEFSCRLQLYIKKSEVGN